MAATYRVLITCPTTGQPTATGILETSAETYAAAEYADMDFGCNVCGANHTWSKSDSWLGEPVAEETFEQKGPGAAQF